MSRTMRAAAPVRTTTRRHPSDVLRLTLGLGILVWAAIAAGSTDPSRAEINLFRLINQLPDPAGAPLVGIMQLGALAAVPVVAVVCVLGRRPRLARLVVLAGLSAWLIAKVARSDRRAAPSRRERRRGAAPRRGDTGALVPLDARCGRGRDGNGREPVPQPLGAPHDVVARVR